MKYCKDCKHVVSATQVVDDYAKCGYDWPLSPVTAGKVAIATLEYAASRRNNKTHCGPTAKHFEEKTND